MIKDKNFNWENEEFKIIAFDYEKYNQMHRKHLYYKFQCKHCGAIFTRKKEAIYKIIHCPSCCHARNGSILSTNLYDMMLHYKSNALNRGIQWNLSEKEFLTLIKGACYYCGEVPTYRKSTLKEKVNGIDRIDSSKDYVFNNCVSCCAVCNRMKSTFSQEEFYNKIKQIYSHSIKSSTTISQESTL